MKKELSLQIRKAISRAMRRCKTPRHLIAAKMTELTGTCVSTGMLDAYAAKSKRQHRFPAEWIPAFVSATGDKRILEIIAEASECKILSGAGILYVEIARLERQEEEIRRRKESLKRSMR